MNNHIVTIFTLNTRGLADKRKRAEVFTWLKDQDASIFFLQETHSTPGIEKSWRDEWGSSGLFFSHGTSNSRGTCVFFSNIENFQVKKEFHDNEGRLVILDILAFDAVLTLVNIYAPNSDDPSFFDLILTQLDQFECQSIVWGGDFNCVLNVNVDKKGGRPVTHTRAVKVINNIIEQFSLTDIWRLKNPSLFRSTWRSRDVRCRLDYFLISLDLVSQTKTCEISPGFKTDHSAVICKIVLNPQPRGRGFWKFNVSLLKDDNYVSLIRETIQSVCNDHSNEMNPNLFWDFLKCELRSVTIAYSIQKSKERRLLEQSLNSNLKHLEDRYADHPDPNLLSQIEECKRELENHYQMKTEGHIIRSRANWVENGERNTNYFINLEKRNQRLKIITAVYNEDGNIVNNTKDILNTQKLYFEKIYKSDNPKLTNLSNIVSFSIDDMIPKLTVNSKEKCEGDITIDECIEALKTMPNNKTPGTDGFPPEFYKHFIQDIGQFLIGSFQYSFDNGILSMDQRRGIINLIPKKDKDPLYLNNWRPISILNTDYKIIAKCLALRLKKVLPEIISNDQTGFLPGRYIGENIRLVLDMIDYTNITNLPGLMLLADFEKAFDKLEWSFLFQTLESFGFGEDFIAWIKTMYMEVKSCVLNNGHASEFFQLHRGLRQGCPLSPLLFLLCSEILAIWARNDTNVQGIQIGNADIFISAYADDTTFFLKDQNSLFHLMSILDRFKSISGLAINRNKSEVVALGYYKAHPPDISSSGLFFSSGPFRLLGVKFSISLDDLFELNYLPKKEKLINILKVWSMRYLTPIGKIVILKSLALSQLIFLLSVLPSPPEHFMKEIDSIVYSFLWDDKPDKISRRTIIGDYSQGGLKMFHLPSVNSGLKIAWIKRLLNIENKGKWKCFFDYHLQNFGGKLIWHCNINPKEKKIDIIRNTFIREIVNEWSKYTFESIISSNQIRTQCLWHNSHIRINNQMLYRKVWYQCGVSNIDDLLIGDVFLEFEQFQEKFKVKCNFLEYYSLLHAIPGEWKKKLVDNIANENSPHCSSQKLAIFSLQKTAKVCRYIHRKLIDKIFQSPKSEQKWLEILKENIDFSVIYMIPFKATLNQRLRYFQFRILHRILGVNKLLSDMGISDNNICSLCSKSVETISHLFWECNVTKEFILQLQTAVLTGNISITKQLFLFGSNDVILKDYNFIFLYAKYFIFMAKDKTASLYLPSFCKMMQQIKNTEQYMSTTRKNYELYMNKWKLLKLN